ncbi:MAG: cytochrome P460 family protein [Bacteroidales bacterium]|nr:cytochrome P460 family protein [Bacteroidales bacterium]
MKNKKLLTMIFAAIMVSFVFTSCNDDDEPEEQDEPFTLTQAKLDAVNSMIGTYTGFSAGQDVTVAHNGGMTSTPDSTVREVYASVADLSGDIAVGTIVTKKVYDKNFTTNGKGDKLFVTLAMVKREKGYDPDNGDWEYVMMPNDGSADYEKNPFGVLPAAESDMRGKLQMCISCHAKDSDGDYLFVDGI